MSRDLATLVERVRVARVTEQSALARNQYSLESGEVIGAVGARSACEHDVSSYLLDHPEAIEAYEAVLALGKAQQGVEYWDGCTGQASCEHCERVVEVQDALRVVRKLADRLAGGG